MCDYCGCRQSAAAIDELSLEHEQVLELTSRLRRLADDGDHAGSLALVDELEPLLAVHTAKEEQGLFTALRRAWDTDDRLDALTQEHRDVDELLPVVRAGGPGWRTAARALSELLSQHIMDEETDLFPYAIYELGADEWASIDDVHDRLGSSVRRRSVA